MNSLTCKNKVIEYTVVKTKRKTIGIKISEEGKVIVAAPLYLSNRKIEEIVESKTSWIEEKLNQVKEFICINKEYVSGNTLPFLGNNYEIEIKEARSKTDIYFDMEKLIIMIDENIEEDKYIIIRNCLVKWYRQQATRIFYETTKFYEEKLNLHPKKITIKEQKTRWGSCSSLGNINYNWKVILAPIEIVDYLVVHELCHLRHGNHSKDFWKLVESILPNYKEHRLWLKTNGFKLKI